MNAKIDFLKLVFPQMLHSLDPEAKGAWGKLNAQQMVEHLTESLYIANGKLYQKPELTPEQTEKVRSFFLSDKPFRENTTNHLLPDVPPPARNPSMVDSIAEFDKELDLFFAEFEGDDTRQTLNPFAGPFGFKEWVQLLHKHFVHHAKQFGLME